MESAAHLLRIAAACMNDFGTTTANPLKSPDRYDS
jgi:hypothetical protein